MNAAWAEILARPAWRGELAGYSGTAILEEADEDGRVVRFRLQGACDGATASATVTARLTAAGPDVRAEVHPGHGSDLSADRLVAAVHEALAAAGRGAPEGGGAPALDRPPARPAPPAAPAPLVAAAVHRRSGRPALVAGAAAAALAAWALKGRR